MNKRPDEFELIATYFAPLAADPSALGLTDDAAVLPGTGTDEIVMTADALVAGVHFLPDDPPGQVAQKLLRVNLSDLAAKGATPKAYLLTVALPADWTADWIGAFADGLARDQETYGISLVGGDTVSTPGPMTLSLTAVGSVAAGCAVRRAGAKAGDRIWVTGTIGDAALGLRVLKGQLAGLSQDARDFLADRFRLPQPRVTLGPRLPGHATAAIDVSDGLIADLNHVCETSALGALVRADGVPLSGAARQALGGGEVAIGDLLTGGDDYELLFTAPADRHDDIAELADAVSVPLTEIGEMTEARGVHVALADGSELEIADGGYRHF
jgi:thiamine-monophosphate kinase